MTPRPVLVVLAAVLAASLVAPVAVAGPVPAPSAESCVLLLHGPDGLISEPASGTACSSPRPDLFAVSYPQLVTPASMGDPLLAQALHLQLPTVRELWPTTTGTGVIVAVIDTGVDRSKLNDEISLVPGIDFVNKGGDGLTDLVAHGSLVAGIIGGALGNGLSAAGVAPGTKIMPVRVIDGFGNGSTADVAQGIVWATDNGAKVINMSLGTALADPAMDKAIEYAATRDVIMVAATGNGSRTDGISYPASHPKVLAVGAVNPDLTLASFSNAGPQVDLVAHGKNLRVPSFGRLGNGTSFAAPQVAGYAALLRAARPTATAAQIRTALRSTAWDLGPAGRDDSYGLGLSDPSAALRYLAGKRPQPTSFEIDAAAGTARLVTTTSGERTVQIWTRPRFRSDLPLEQTAEVLTNVDGTFTLPAQPNPVAMRLRFAGDDTATGAASAVVGIEGASQATQPQLSVRGYANLVGGDVQLYTIELTTAGVPQPDVWICTTTPVTTEFCTLTNLAGVAEDVAQLPDTGGTLTARVVARFDGTEVVREHITTFRDKPTISFRVPTAAQPRSSTLTVTVATTGIVDGTKAVLQRWTGEQWLATSVTATVRSNSATLSIPVATVSGKLRVVAGRGYSTERVLLVRPDRLRIGVSLSGRTVFVEPKADGKTLPPVTVLYRKRAANGSWGTARKITTDAGVGAVVLTKGTYLLSLTYNGVTVTQTVTIR
jgi:hypothetical protein